MTSAITSSAPLPYRHTEQIKGSPAPTPAIDADGDHDGSQPGEVEKPQAVFGPIGTIIDTRA